MPGLLFWSLDGNPQIRIEASRQDARLAGMSLGSVRDAIRSDYSRSIARGSGLQATRMHSAGNSPSRRRDAPRRCDQHSSTERVPATRVQDRAEKNRSRTMSQYSRVRPPMRGTRPGDRLHSSSLNLSRTLPRALACRAGLSGKPSSRLRARQRSASVASKTLAVAGNHQRRLELLDQVQRRGDLVECLLAFQLGKDDAEAVLPQRVGRDQRARLRLEQDDGMRIVARRSVDLPLQAAQPHARARLQQRRRNGNAGSAGRSAR